MKNDILLFITISLGITILSLIPPQFVYAFDTSPVRHEADEVPLKPIRQASDSKRLGIDVSPKGIGNQALHPEGQLHFLITINQHILVSTLCTNIIDLRMVSESHDQIYAEEVVLHENSILQRSISVQRPNQLIVFVEVESCEANINPKGKTIFAFYINEIFSDQIPLKDQWGNEIKRPVKKN